MVFCQNNGCFIFTCIVNLFFKRISIRAPMKTLNVKSIHIMMVVSVILSTTLVCNYGFVIASETLECIRIVRHFPLLCL